MFTTAGSRVGRGRIPNFRGVVPLIDQAAGIVIDASLGINFEITLRGNRTFLDPQGMFDGQPMNLFIDQDGTGSRLWTPPASFIFPAAAGFTLSTPANSRDLICMVYRMSARKWFDNGSKAYG